MHRLCDFILNILCIVFVSERATADTKPTETKNDTVVINLVEPEHQSDDQALSPSNDRTVDWELLGEKVD